TDSLYVMLAGRARVYVSNAQGREVQLNLIGAGEYFGEVTLDGGARSASVMAAEDCRCAVVKRGELLTLVEKEPQFALHMVRKLASRVRDLTENVRSLALMDVYGRVARLLAAVLSSVSAVHRELGEQPGRLPAVEELVRRVGVLELLLLNLAGRRRIQSEGELAHGTRAQGIRRRRPARAGGIRDVGR